MNAQSFDTSAPLEKEYGHIYDSKGGYAQLTIEQGSSVDMLANVRFEVILATLAEAQRDFIPASMRLLLAPHIVARMDREAEKFNPENDVLLANLFLTTLTNFLNFPEEAQSAGKKTSFMYNTQTGYGLHGAVVQKTENGTVPDIHNKCSSIKVYRSKGEAREVFAVIEVNEPFGKPIREVMPALMEAMDVYKDRLPKTPSNLGDPTPPELNT